MPRSALRWTSVLLIALLAVVAIPHVPRIAAAVPTGECAISSSVTPVTLVALPSERPMSAADPSGSEPLPLPPVTLAAIDKMIPRLADGGDARRLPAMRAEQLGWLHSRQRRARAPDDPDPL